MAIQLPRERPFVQFNFLVNLGIGPDAASIDAGFQEVSGLGMEVTVSEYRPGNKKENNVMKIKGLNKSADVTLKRGIIGSDTLYKWLDKIRQGDQTQNQNVTIQLQSEDHTTTVATWTLMNACPIKYTCGPLNAKGTDVAMEELVLSFERFSMEVGR
jgi:phage tail-like protein